MTAAASVRPLDRAARPLPLAPAEGWLTVILVALMAAAVCWSIDDGAWILGRGNLTDFMVPVTIAGVLVGFAGGKLRWSRWRTHVAGALLAAVVLPLIGAWLLKPTQTDPVSLFRLMAQVVGTVWVDFVVQHRTTTREFGHYMLFFGVLAWGTGQYAGYAVFGHRRPFDAALVLGLTLLLSMALNEHDQLFLLVAFTVAALLLMNRSHALDERTKWLRSRIGDPAAVRGAYQRGGAIFVTLAVAGAVVLTATARSAPLQSALADLPQRLVEISQSLQRFLPTGGSNRTVSALAFGAKLPIANRWGSQDGTAFTAVLPAGETQRLYWRAVTYAKFDLNSWTFGSTHATSRVAGAPLLKGLADDPQQLQGRRAVTITIRPEAYRGDVVMAPQTILNIDRAASINVTGSAGYFTSANSSGTGPYVVTALVPTLGDDQPGALTQNRLRAAGTDYPTEIRALYLDVPAGAIGPQADALLGRIRSQVGTTTPFDTAAGMVNYFRNPSNFTYDTDLREAACDGLSTVECFAKVRRGFCQYYASTMTILLREMGIAARYVEGFLPGTRSGGIETIAYASAHAWVEVYFPGFGWVEFDPTGGGVSRDVALPSGQPVAQATFDPDASVVPVDNPGDETGLDGAGNDTFDPGAFGGDSTISFILVGLLLALGVMVVAIRVTIRGPRGQIGPDQAWVGLVGLARRFGLGPRPAQTVYEYAGMLGEAMPTVRPELATVANAKVEVTYGRRALGDERLRAMRDASVRLRMQLLRLAVRGRLRRPRSAGLDPRLRRRSD